MTPFERGIETYISACASKRRVTFVTVCKPHDLG
jgi:hypothetical protein